MKEEIQQQYNQVLHKGRFIELCAEHFERSSGTLKNHWFATKANIPKKHQKEVLRLLKRWNTKQERLVTNFK